METQADICILVEGSYPYVSGGVGSWIQQLIEAQKDKTFYIISIVAPTQKLTPCYVLPKNVIGLYNIVIQQLPYSLKPLSKANRKIFYLQFELAIHDFLIKGKLESLNTLLSLLERYPNACCDEVLLNSEEAWQILLNFYQKHINASSFIDFFWAWRNLFSALYSVLVVPIPPAKLYHAICTGYAGLLMAKANLKYKVPCLLTEHGIYTNERQIEITLADWIEYQKNFSLQMGKAQIDLDLKDFWMHAFVTYAQICYECCSEIITLFEGNKDLQIANGAAVEKLRVIPNGVDYASLSQIKRDENHPPTIALIGRVVPIKDVQTFIQACIIVQAKIPTLRAYIIGSTDEDRNYYSECMDTVRYANMEKTIVFTGKVNIKDYLSIIDITVLTSLSEAQPLALLEAGAAGIPCVATDVGACRELLYGKYPEVKEGKIIKGGEIVEVCSPQAIAEALLCLLPNKTLMDNYREVLKNRIYQDYNKRKIDQQYHELYQTYLVSPPLHSVA